MGHIEDDSGCRTTASYPYRNAQLDLEERVDDLLSRMTLAEKAGLMFHDAIAPDYMDASPDAALDVDRLIDSLHMRHFNVRGSISDVRAFAEWYNRLQERAAASRLGIPVTLSTDPRHHFGDNTAVAGLSGGFSQWPETLGLAALRSAELVSLFADVVRQEYLAVGFRSALHPQIDLATEPRWARISGTFGEDDELTAALGYAYVHGLQGETLCPESVAAMVKHFPGGGPQLDGEDPHFDYGRDQIYPGDKFQYHLNPFRAVLRAGPAQIMPYYGLPRGTEYEEVAFGFNRGIITELLRGHLAFDGVVCTDWGLITGGVVLGQHLPARAWGVEELDDLSRAQKVIDAGCDQFGGETRPELIVDLVERGRVSEGRVDESVRRILRPIFLMGLFERPFVDVDAAVSTVGRADFVEQGKAAQSASTTVLTNQANFLPVNPGKQLFVEGIDKGVAAAYGSLVDNPSDADLAVVRVAAPFDERPGGFEKMFHAGSLAFPTEEVKRLVELAETVPTVLEVYLDRPAILTDLTAAPAALLVSYGSSDQALLDVVFGRAEPRGKLPFDLPRSMRAVVESRSDVSFDTANPLFRFGHGLRLRGGDL